MKLKVELHAHCMGDPIDDWIRLNAEELIKKLVEKRYHAGAITNHLKIMHTRELADYAAERGFLLFAGMEALVHKKHILFYVSPDAAAIKELNDYSKFHRGEFTFEDIRRFKREGLIEAVGAPHAYHVLESLGNLLLENLDVFDIVELSWYHTGIEFPRSLAFLNPFNRNQHLAAVIRAKGIPFFAASDSHRLKEVGRGYSMLEVPDDYLDAPSYPTGSGTAVLKGQAPGTATAVINGTSKLELIMDALKSKDQSRIGYQVEPVTLRGYFAALPELVFPSRFPE